jgi:formylglycine-generating enzyme required for sulfatase activity
MTALEWYTAARGTPDGKTNCVISGGTLQKTGSEPLCTSGIGAFDMIGNVWELVSDTIVDGMVTGNPLPVAGYVAAVTPDGLPQKTALVPNVIYNKDYFWSEASGTFALMRGGYYGSGDDGGMYSSHADIEQTFSSTAVGFRCVSVL